MNILKKLVHTNIVRLHEIIDDPSCEYVYLVMDFLPGGSLDLKLKQSESGLDEETVRTLFSQLVSAVHYCHEVINFSHRDIKPANIMLDDLGKHYLCDFGVS